MRLAISEDNGESWSVYHDTDVEQGSVRAGHEYSYMAAVPWPQDSAEEGVSISYTWQGGHVAVRISPEALPGDL
jgi:hypothetical protein